MIIIDNSSGKELAAKLMKEDFSAIVGAISKKTHVRKFRVARLLLELEEFSKTSRNEFDIEKAINYILLRSRIKKRTALALVNNERVETEDTNDSRVSVIVGVFWTIVYAIFAFFAYPVLLSKTDKLVKIKYGFVDASNLKVAIQFIDVLMGLSGLFFMLLMVIQFLLVSPLCPKKCSWVKKLGFSFAMIGFAMLVARSAMDLLFEGSLISPDSLSLISGCCFLIFYLCILYDYRKSEELSDSKRYLLGRTAFLAITLGYSLQLLYSIISWFAHPEAPIALHLVGTIWPLLFALMGYYIYSRGGTQEFASQVFYLLGEKEHRFLTEDTLKKEFGERIEGIKNSSMPQNEKSALIQEVSRDFNKAMMNYESNKKWYGKVFWFALKSVIGGILAYIALKGLRLLLRR
ncbi:hypothetical protein [Mesotoga sp. UBA5557]|uniref:hypothetical protein n=1 Tax=Mesotoga sp. UBA5557 TaxID=1946857 RepID=UPI0025E26ADD|nr:hypothetical protein [Mesotoga sp. UBA5557]